MHKLLQRQLTKLIGDQPIENLPLPWKTLLEAVDKSYEQADADRILMERSLELSSKELLQSNTDIQAIFQAFPDLFFRINEEGAILDYKGGAAADFYISPNKLIGKRIQDIPVKNIGEKFQAAVQELKKTHSPVTIQYEINTQEKSDFYEARFLPILRGQIFVAIRNISETKKLEAMVLQSEKLSAVGQLASGVAHEINNPLGVILGFAQGMIKRIKESDPFFVPVQSIEREAKRCKTLVQDLLVFSRSNKTEKEECDLNETVRVALSFVQAQTKMKSVELVEEFGEDLPKAVVNRNQIQQVIVNLCNNALDAMPKGGKLTIRTKVIGQQSVVLSQKGNAPGQGPQYVQISVSDTGIGIPEEFRLKIFDPFFTTKEAGKGTGLGLSLVHEIVQKHQGNISVTSMVGEGTTFHVSLPAPGPGTAVPFKRNLILIVDDEPEILKMIQRSLFGLSFDLLTATDGFKAGKLLAEKKPDLVILDIFLPGVDGFKICGAIRSDGRLRDIKILAISGTDVRETETKVLQAGADDFLAKPFKPDELKSKVEALLGIEV